MSARCHWLLLLALLGAAVARAPVADGEDAADRGSASALQTQITISKETTRIVAPLRPDGYPDYVAALDQSVRAGVRPDENFVVVLWRVTGPPDIAAADREAYFRRLGIRQPAPDGKYFQSFFRFMRERDPIDPDASKTVPSDSPAESLLTAWLRQHQTHLNQIQAASRRADYYSPLAHNNSGHLPMLSTGMMLAHQNLRNVARALMLRATMRLSENKVEMAWQDVIACYRTARLVGKGPSVIDGLLSVAIENMAFDGLVAILQHEQLGAEQIDKMRADMRALPPLPKMAGRIDTAERYLFLDSVCTAGRLGAQKLMPLLQSRAQDGQLASIAEKLGHGPIDWNEVLRMGNGYYDRLAAIALLPPARRHKQLDKFRQDLARLDRAVAKSLLGVPLLVLGGDEGKRILSRQVGGILIGMLVRPLDGMITAEARRATRSQLAELMLAVAAYRRDNARYPTGLEQLCPDYLQELPLDRFSAAPFRYRSLGDEYLLYSLGANGQDDGGRNRKSKPPGDDVSTAAGANRS